MKKSLVTLVSILLVTLLLCVCVGGARADESADGGSGEKYKIALSNSFIGNGWRQEMQKIAEYVASQPPYSDKCTLTVINSDNTAEAQAASIDAIIMDGYDAILIDSASGTALNAAVKRAVQQGIVVVSFDSIVVSDDNYQIQGDFDELASVGAKYICEKLGGKGNVVVDRGMPGTEASNPLYISAMEVFNSYPDIEVVHEFDGKYAEGDTLAGMNAAIAANPQIDGVYSQGYISPIIKALKEAGRDPAVVAGYSYNGGMLDILNNEGQEGVVFHQTPGVSAFALKMALDVLDGEKEWPIGEVINDTILYYATDTSIDCGVTLEQLELGVNVFEDVPPDFMIPTVEAEVGIEVPIDVVL